MTKLYTTDGTLIFDEPDLTIRETMEKHRYKIGRDYSFVPILVEANLFEPDLEGALSVDYLQIINTSDKIKELLAITEKQFEDLIIYQNKFEIKFDNMPYKIILSTQKLDSVRDLFFIVSTQEDLIIDDKTKNQIMQELENGNYEVIAKSTN